MLLRSVWGGWVTYHPSHAPTPDPEGTTSDTSAMRSNQRDGECETCGSVVPAWHSRARLGHVAFT